MPVGLLFDAKQAFRSRALVQVGEPIDPSPELGMAQTADSEAAFRSLTARIDEALKDVTLNYETWEDARLVARAADLYRRRAPELPGRGRLSESVTFQRAFLEGYQDLRARHPERVAAVAQAVREYDRLLHACGLRDDQVGAAYPPSPGAPLRPPHPPAPARPPAGGDRGDRPQLARLPPGGGDREARHPQLRPGRHLQGLRSLILFPLTWILEGWLVSRYVGSCWLGAAVTLLAPFAAYGALLFHDQRAVFWREARAYLLLRTRRRLAAELKTRREEVLRQVEELETLYEEA